MVTSQSVTRFDGADVVPLMTADEARVCVNDINHHMNSARARLLELYERRGWSSLGYASWRECVVSEFSKSKSQLYDELEAAQIERRISGTPENQPIPTRQLIPLRHLTPIEQPAAWQRAQEIAEQEGERLSSRHVEEAVREWRDADDDELDPPMELEQVADQFPGELTEVDRELLETSLPSVSRVNAGLFTSATPEWYTPRHIIDRVLAVFHDQIDLDPCSNSDDPDQANVPAVRYWTQQTDGLAQAWRVDDYTRVYMNPPYGDEIGAWVDRLVQAYDDEEIGEAIALLPARTDTNWFQPLKNHTLCFVKGRLRFSGAENSAPFPSVVVYMGSDVERFKDTFGDIGFCMRAA